MKLRAKIERYLETFGRLRQVENKITLLTKLTDQLIIDEEAGQRKESEDYEVFFDRVRALRNLNDSENMGVVYGVVQAIQDTATELYGDGDVDQANEIYGLAAILEDQFMVSKPYEVDTDSFEEMSWTPERTSLSRKYGLHIKGREEVGEGRYIGFARKKLGGSVDHTKNYLVLLDDEKVLSGGYRDNWGSIEPQEDGTFLAKRREYGGFSNQTLDEIYIEELLDNDGKTLEGYKQVVSKRKGRMGEWQQDRETEIELYGKNLPSWGGLRFTNGEDLEKELQDREIKLRLFGE
jgi:hypothetical protein